MSDSISMTATRRQPKQARSRMLVASIREACRRILEEDVPDQVLTVSRIAEVAGVTIGSFYQYYANKEALLLDMLLESAPGEAEMIVEESRFLSELRWQSIEQTLRGLVTVTCARHERLLALHGDIYRRFHREADLDSLILTSVKRYASAESLEMWLQELLRHHRPQLDNAAVTLCAFLLASTLNECCARAVEHHPDWLQSEGFRSELQRVLITIATGESQSPSTPT
ncbi:MAG: TetR/AcrR family transcriptional regulator [Halioglobus sp.]|nr:TetR/AcrR family transcriptional regulator [Halioglobus sp.]